MSATVIACPECDMTGGLHLLGCRAAEAITDAERLEAAAAVLERRYPGTRPDTLDNTLYELRCIARSLRRKAAQP